MLELFLNNFHTAFLPINMLTILAGLTSGIIIGAIPGLCAVVAIALLLPFVFTLEAGTGLMLLGAIWVGATFGGANAAILMNVPGTAAAVVTTFDGYPLTLKGKADEALHTALICSVIGGIIGTLVLTFLFGPLSLLSIRIGSPEFFWLAVLGLTTIAAVSPGDLSRGLLGGLIGILLASVGVNPVSGMPRFTFGSYYLMEGINLVPAILGFFSFTQAFILLEQEQQYIAEYKSSPKILRRVIPPILKNWFLILRSSIIGVCVGILPGAGNAIATLLAYNHARNSSKNDPVKFGEGNIKGVMATEACNNATVEGALVPTMGLGIPGNVTSALIMGALLTFGIQPGFDLLTQSGDIAYSFMSSLLVANLLMFPVGLILVKISAKFLLVKSNHLAPSIIYLSMIGAYTATRSFYGLAVMLGCGFLALLCKKAKIPIGPMILGLILGPIAERGLVRSIQLSRVTPLYSILIFRPISLVLIALTIISVLSALKIKKSDDKKVLEN